MDLDGKLNQLSQHHPVLAEIFEAEWNTQAAGYSKRLYQNRQARIETLLLNAFIHEWREMEVDEDKIGKAINQLKEKPVLQTSHHITPTYGPTFLAFDIISLLGLDSTEFYLVGANSGVPFSNSAWTGAINYGTLELEQLLKPDTATFHAARKAAIERKSHGDDNPRISLIPSKSRDQLVYGSSQPETLNGFIQDTSPKLREYLPMSDPSALFSIWALETCQNIQSRLLQHSSMMLFDINRVVNHYLIQVLENEPQHPCSILLTGDNEVSRTIVNAFDNPVIFLSGYRGKKSFKIDSVYKRDSGYFSAKQGNVRWDRSELINEMKNRRLCPGIFLLFFVLRFINGIKCLGSFNQIEYLENQRQVWRRLNLSWDLALEQDSKEALTTGRLIENGAAQWPVDLILSNKHLTLSNYATRSMSFFWTPIIKQLTTATL